MTTLTGCKSALEKQAELRLNELSKKPADKYEEKFEKNDICVHVRDMKKRELKNYYNKTGSKFYDVYFVAVTNKSDKNVILSVSDTSVTTKSGKKIVIGNDLSKLMKKADGSIASKTMKAMGKAGLTAWTFGMYGFVWMTQGEANTLQKTREAYYQATYDKGLQSVVIPPYNTTVGLLVMPDKPFHSYKSVNFKFQKTQRLEYFDLEYPIELTTDKLRLKRQQEEMKLAEQKRKEEMELAKQKRKEMEKQRKEEMKLIKNKHKNI